MDRPRRASQISHSFEVLFPPRRLESARVQSTALPRVLPTLRHGVHAGQTHSFCETAAISEAQVKACPRLLVAVAANVPRGTSTPARSSHARNPTRPPLLRLPPRLLPPGPGHGRNRSSAHPTPLLP